MKANYVTYFKKEHMDLDSQVDRYPQNFGIHTLPGYELKTETIGEESWKQPHSGERHWQFITDRYTDIDNRQIDMKVISCANLTKLKFLHRVRLFSSLFTSLGMWMENDIQPTTSVIVQCKLKCLISYPLADQLLAAVCSSFFRFPRPESPPGNKVTAHMKYTDMLYNSTQYWFVKIRTCC